MLEKPQASAGDIAIVRSPGDLHQIAYADCPGVILNRQPLATFQSWIDGQDAEQLPAARLILRPQEVKANISAACDSAKTPDCAERTCLIDDIAALADIFARVMRAPFLRLRLEHVTTNACRKFHCDAVTARLICTYRGAGTQYGFAQDGADPKRFFSVPLGAPILLRGTRWPDQSRSGLLHRSPPIEGSGDTRLVLVLDPVFDSEEDT